MRPWSKRTWCAIVITALLGLPASGWAQSLTDSAMKITNAELDRALQSSALANQGQPSRRNSNGILKSVVTGAAKGAAIGFIAGLVAGAMVNRYCENENASCSHVVAKVSVTGLGIGAAFGAAAGVSR
jgi:hypothetical protein